MSSLARQAGLSPLRIVALLGLAALGGGCRFVGAKAANLDALHANAGRHSFVAVQETDLGWGSRTALSALTRSLGRDAIEPSASAVEDPVESCQELLEALSEFDSDDFATGSTQVEYFARAAAFDPWASSREIALRELGRAGVRLELGAKPVELGAAEASEAQADEALVKLVAATRKWFETRSGEARAELERTCAEVAALPLALADGLRILHGINVLLRTGVLRDPRLEPLKPLASALQRRVTTQALALALVDAPPFPDGGSDPGWPNERVQAAAVRAAVRIGGERKLAELLARTPFSSLGGERLVAALECVAALGLPALEGERGAAQRAQWAEAIYLTAVEHPDGRVRLAAMKALGKLSGRGLVTLRELDWQNWWLAEGRSAYSAGAKK